MKDYIKLLDLIEEATGQDLVFMERDITEGIVYNIIPITNNGVKRQDKLEIRIISKNISTINELHDKINSVLLTVGDSVDPTIRKITLNGGGLLKQPESELLHHLSYYYINKIN